MLLLEDNDNMGTFRENIICLIAAASKNTPKTSNNQIYNLTAGDWINGLLLLVTAAGLIFAGIQLKQTKDINRASLVKELYLMFYNNDQIRQIFYKIEWSAYKKEESIKLNSNEEQQVDMLLSFFEVVCDMYYRKVLLKEDLRVFDYEMHRTYEHPGIQHYLAFLSKWQKERNIGESYSSYKRYCKESFSSK